MQSDDDDDLPPAPPQRYCTQCKASKPVTAFNCRKGEYGKLCKVHAAIHAAQTKAKRQESALKRRYESSDEDEPFNPATGKMAPIKIDWPRLVALFDETSTTVDTCEWIVTFTNDDILTSSTEPKAFARAIANEVWESTGYRQIPKGRGAWSSSDTITSFRYHCSQCSAEALPARQNDRVRSRMIRYPCRGMLSIVVNSSNMLEVTIRWRHLVHHEAYCDVAIPDEAKDYIKERKDKTPGVLYGELKDKFKNRAYYFTQKQIHAYWCDVNKRTWKLDEDQLTSAAMILARHNEDQIERVTLPEERGISAFAFVLKDVLIERGRFIDELAMDSTWKTNKLGYELYAFVGEANGIALPFLYMFIGTDSSSSRGAKQRMLAACLRHILPTCPNIKFVLSDKDASEINAISEVLPEAKHQLCYWHVLRYLMERLSQNKKPRAYDADAAHGVYAFIDPEWSPGYADEYDTESEVAPLNEENLELATRNVAERRRKNRVVIFCPLEHRATIKEMHRRIMCMHPMIPSGYHDNASKSDEQIHEWATREIYEYCRQNDLLLVWVYLWNQWYKPAQWVLWSRSAGNEIPRIRTTMMVESLWNTIKHKYLIDFNRPRLDLTIHLILKHALPTVRGKLQLLAGTFRPGRGPTLLEWQKDLRSQWVKRSATGGMTAEEQALEGEEDNEDGEAGGHPTRNSAIVWFNAVEPIAWMTNPDRWVCSCPAFLLNRFLVCKHLIRMVNTQLDDAPVKSLSFFAELRRFHTAPFYRIPGIHRILPDPTRPAPAAPGPSVRLSTQVRSTTTSVVPSESFNNVTDFTIEQGNDGVIYPTLANPIPDRVAVTRASRRVEEGEVDNTRRQFDQVRARKLRAHFDVILREIGPDRHLHVKHLAAMESTLAGVEELGTALKEDDTRRTLPTTWRDWNNFTAYR